MEALEQDELPVPPSGERPLSAMDVESALLALSGQSALDWFHLRFPAYEDVNAFLRLWHCDVTRHVWARERLRYVYNQAVNYLEDHVGLTIRPEVRRPRDVRDAFLRASTRDRFSRDGIQYCAVLKLLHVVNHLEMQELRSQTPIRELDLIDLANGLVLRAAQRMRQEGFPLRAFYGNRKTRPSVITKLLAKRESTAATIYDKLRFRIVTEDRADLVPALAWLTRNLIPFPAITPGESHNNLLTAEELSQLARAVAEPTNDANPWRLPPPNPFSAAAYRSINFIAALPVRVYDLPGVPVPRHRALLGEAVSVSVEFQLVDAETDARNEAGDGRHELYKNRQLDKVYERLGRSPAARR